METSSLQLPTGLAPRDGAKKREAAGHPSSEGMPWRVVPKEVGAPACGMEARAWRESPDAPARRPQDRYLGTGSQHATAAASIRRQRPRVGVAERAANVVNASSRDRAAIAPPLTKGGLGG